MALHPHELIRRWLIHVLPKGFARVRHYGFMSSAACHTLETIRLHLGADPKPEPPTSRSQAAHLPLLWREPHLPARTRTHPPHARPTGETPETIRMNPTRSNRQKRIHTVMRKERALGNPANRPEEPSKSLPTPKNRPLGQCLVTHRAQSPCDRPQGSRRPSKTPCRNHLDPVERLPYGHESNPHNGNLLPS